MDSAGRLKLADGFGHGASAVSQVVVKEDECVVTAGQEEDADSNGRSDDNGDVLRVTDRTSLGKKSTSKTKSTKKSSTLLLTTSSIVLDCRVMIAKYVFSVVILTQVMKSKTQRLTHEQTHIKEKIKDNNDKIENNRQLPYLVGMSPTQGLTLGNVIEILDMDTADGVEEEGMTYHRRR
jgi:hypothetical protein